MANRFVHVVVNMLEKDCVILQARHVLTLRTVLNPQNKYNRDTLNDNFGIVLPLIQQKKQSKVC